MRRPLVFVGMLCSIIACEEQEDQTSTAAVLKGCPSTNETFTYNDNVKAIFDTQCVACHSGSSASDGVHLDTYSGASTNASKALSEIAEGAMPPANAGSVSDEQLCAIAHWIDAGKDEGTPVHNNTSDSTDEITYTNTVKAIFDTNCVACHNADSHQDDVRLDTYATAQSNASRALDEIDDGEMPPDGWDPVSNEDAAAIAAWIDAGKPE